MRPLPLPPSLRQVPDLPYPLSPTDDELHNVNLAENAKTKHALEQKKKGTQTYTGYDDAEFEGGPGSSRGVLSKYDEGFDAQQVDGFRLGASAPSAKGKGRAVDGAGRDDGGEREKIKLSMDYTSAHSLPSYSLTLLSCR